MRYKSYVDARGRIAQNMYYFITCYFIILFNLHDIWRIRNRKTKRLTFRQQHCSGFIQRRLDYIFICNTLQESVLNTEVLPAFLNDCSSVFITYSEMINIPIAPGFWKFNSTSLNNETFKMNLRDFIEN